MSSGEDPPGGQTGHHSRESSLEMSGNRTLLRPRSPTIDLDKNSEEMISLMQFLEESDRSPSSRVRPHFLSPVFVQITLCHPLLADNTNHYKTW